MKPSSLPTLHKFIDNGWQLRTEMAHAISSMELYAKKGSVLPAGVAKLKALFDAGNTALAAIGDLPASIVASAADTAMAEGSDTTEQIVVTATQLDGGTANVAANCTYVSSNTDVITVSATGLVTVVGPGSATVTAQYLNKTSNALAFTVTGL